MAEGERYVLDFLLAEGEQGWHARCLEYDFVTQADTLQDLYYEIQRTVIGHLTISWHSGRPPFEGLTRAAREYWDLFEQSNLTLRPREFAIHAIPEAVRAALPTPELRELRVATVS